MNVHGLILPSRIVGLMFLLFAVCCAGVATWFYMSTRSFLNQAVPVPGTVIANVRSGTGGETTFHAVYEFVDSQGVRRQTTSRWSSNPPVYAVGEGVEVLCSPTDPSDTRIRSFFGLWLFTIVFGASAIIPAILSVAFLWFLPFTIKRVWPTKPSDATRPAAALPSG